MTPKRSIFFFGLVIGTLTGLLIWYWQKSTSAEDGALDLLDRYAAARARISELEMSNAVAQSARHISVPPINPAREPDELERINGIGPTYARRLHDAGVTTFEALAAQSPERLQAITKARGGSGNGPGEWITEALKLSRQR